MSEPGTGSSAARFDRQLGRSVDRLATVSRETGEDRNFHRVVAILESQELGNRVLLASRLPTIGRSRALDHSPLSLQRWVEAYDDEVLKIRPAAEAVLADEQVGLQIGAYILGHAKGAALELDTRYVSEALYSSVVSLRPRREIDLGSATLTIVDGGRRVLVNERYVYGPVHAEIRARAAGWSDPSRRGPRFVFQRQVRFDSPLVVDLERMRLTRLEPADGVEYPLKADDVRDIDEEGAIVAVTGGTTKRRWREVMWAPLDPFPSA